MDELELATMAACVADRYGILESGVPSLLTDPSFDWRLCSCFPKKEIWEKFQEAPLEPRVLRRAAGINKEKFEKILARAAYLTSNFEAASDNKEEGIDFIHQSTKGKKMAASVSGTTTYSKSVISGLLVRLGFEKAANWSTAVLEKRIQMLDKMVSDLDPEDFSDEDNQLVDAIINELDNGVAIRISESVGVEAEIEIDEEEEKPAKKKASKKSVKKMKDEKDEEDEDEEDEDEEDEDEEEDEKPAKKMKEKPAKKKASKKAAKKSVKKKKEGKPSKKVAKKVKEEVKNKKGTRGISNKEKAYKKWLQLEDKSGKQAKKMHEYLKGEISMVTIRCWLSRWRNGYDLPACARDEN